MTEDAKTHQPSAGFFSGLTWYTQATPGRGWAAALGIATSVILLGLLVEHRAQPSHSADNTLVAVTFGVVIPLLALLMVGRTFPERLERSLGPLARHGADRRWLLAGTATGLGLGLAASGAALAVLTRLLGGSPTSLSWADLFSCAWIGALAGLVYTAWFLLGSSIWSRGRGRWLALALDWLLGIGSGIVALPWPRGHLRNLLGGEAVAGLAQAHASAVLVLFALGCSLLVWVRTPR